MSKQVTTPDPDNTEQPDLDDEASIWVRGLYMLLFGVVAHITELVIGLVMLVQFILKAATDKTNINLLSFGDQLSKYLFEIVQFLTFNSEDKPFPFNSWPKAAEQLETDED